MKKAGKSMSMRLVCILVATVVAFVGVASVRLVTIMVVKGEHYQNLASQQQLYDSMVSAPRGNIYDSEMNLLATSATAWTVYLTPHGIQNLKDAEKAEKIRNTLADGLAPILSLEREELYQKTTQDLYYVLLAKRVEKDVVDAVRAFIAADENEEFGLAQYVGIDETSKRYYPNNTLASCVLGFVGDDNQGLAGLESYYDNELTGVSGRVVAAKNAAGTDMPFTYKKVEEAQDGHSLVSTIKSYVQYVCEKYLDTAVEVNKVAERGAIVVMDVNNGAIYGMAVSGDFDPNNPFVLSAEDQAKVDAVTNDEERTALRTQLLNRQWRNKAVSDTYEPGSVFKIFTASTALEEKLVGLPKDDRTDVTRSFTCNYSINVSGTTYHCWKNGGHGTQNLMQAIANSCNPAFITIGQLIGAHTFSKYFEAFGLTEKTGIDLPGEATSTYHKEEDMGITELSSSSFGQTFNLTSLQTLTIAAAAVNGGYLVQPHVVSKIIDSDKKLVRTVDDSPKRQVISQSTSATMRELLEYVIQNGAKNGIVAGYRVGGKTGTSQKLTKILETGDKGFYIASYVGIAPIDDPSVAVLVMLDEPNGAYYGGTIAAPVGAQVMADILPYLGHDPQYTEAELKRLSVTVPDTVGQELSAAKGILAQSELVYRVVGQGNTVVRQLPEVGSSLSKNGTVILYTDESTDESVHVPDFVGMTATETNEAAAAAGVNIQFSGNTTTVGLTVNRQNIAAGTDVPAGTVITVYFVDESTVDIAEG